MSVPRGVRVASLSIGGCALAAAAMTVSTAFAWQHFLAAAQRYRSLAGAPPAQVDKTIVSVGGPLVYGGVVTFVLALLFGMLAFALRRSGLGWVRPTVWAVILGGGVLLLVNLVGSVAGTGAAAGTGITPRDLLGYDLEPDWYPAVHALLGIVTLALIVAGAVAAGRSSIVDFHRKETFQPADPRSTFVVGRVTEKGAQIRPAPGETA